MTHFRLMVVTLAALCANHLAGAADTDKPEQLKHSYQVNINQPCGGSCIIAFPAITNARTMVLKVSCNVVAETSSVSAALFRIEDFTTEFGTVADSTLQPFSFSTNNGITIIGLNGEPHLVIEVGQTPQVIVTTAGTLDTMDCTLSGYY